MSDIRLKPTTVPTKVCPYGEKCYRKNPIHFGELSHPHLHDIVSNGVDSSTKQYKIPQELLAFKEIILIQLQILEKLFPQLNVSQDNQKGNQTDSNDKEDDSEDVIFVSEQENKKELCNSESIRKRPSPTEQENNKTANDDPRPSTSSWNDVNESRLSKKPKTTKNIKDYIPVVLPKGQAASKLEKAAPYNVFLTAITDSEPTHNEPLTITLQEILDESLGEIESSVQINFMIDIGWLLGHYYFAGCLETPLLVLYGDESEELRRISQHKPQVTAIKIQMSSPFATHHSKVMILGYKDGSMRIVISTANLYEDDWHNRTQGLWISPKLNALDEDANAETGESPTGFRNDFMLYLAEYKISKLQPWIARIRKTDFSSINVFFVASVPGGFRTIQSSRGPPWGHARLGHLLNKHCVEVPETSPVVTQSSSIGSLGPNIQSWVMNDFVNSARKDLKPLGIRRIPHFKLIYPSYGNVKNSHDGMLGGGCLPYGKNTNDKQPWLKEYLHQWKSDSRHRSRAMPHIKTYCRWSEAGLHWFVITSANLSKAAWGAFNKASKIDPALRIMNYEVGVLFLPGYVTGEDTFPLDKPRDGMPPFPMPYDIPLTPYGPDDKPFLMDYLMRMGH